MSEELKKLTHINQQGRARMVDVGEKDITRRVAKAVGYVKVNSETFQAIKQGVNKKGDVLGTAQVAGIMAAKKTSDIIPMCHTINLTGVDIDFTLVEPNSQGGQENGNGQDGHRQDGFGQIIIESVVSCQGKTGVEMEALTAVSVAALTIYDMCKSMQRDIVIENISLKEKIGGKSGLYSWSNHA